MGEMADMANDRGWDEEAQLDEYLGGGMSDHEAYESGILDESGGIIGIEDRHFDRLVIGTRAELDSELWRQEQALSGYSQPVSYPRSPSRNHKQTGLNNAAQRNLRKPVPTCNTCHRPMGAREGKFGKFYFCKCPEQATVSDTYWQKIRIK